MIREAICPTCHTEVEIDAKGRCVICGHLILETEKEVKAKQDATKKRIAKEEEAERKAKQEEKT